MFADESLESVGVESLWRKSQQSSQDSRGCQTRAVPTREAEVQAVSTAVKESQTEDGTAEPRPPSGQQPPPPGLLDFLQRVENTVIKELTKNATSHAFHGFQVNWEDHSRQVLRLHQLQQPSAQQQGLQITGVSWSCTGAVLACAYGRLDDGDWSRERACVCTWNLDRRALDPRRADLVLDVPTAVTSISFHPTRPALLAGGLYSGEVVVWDTSASQELLMARTGMSADCHREPVYQVEWVPNQRRGELGVLSACSGGRVLLWTLDSAAGRLVLSAGYALVQQQLPRVSSKARGSSNVGVTSLALSPWDPDMFLVGSEGGLLLRCSFSAQTPAAVPPGGESVPLRAPAVFSFRPRGGPVHSLHCSPFHRNLFASVGTDGLAHLHSLLQAGPLLSLRVADAYVFALRWSPTRPLVLAAATGQGAVQIFDLGLGSLRPAVTMEPSTPGAAASCLAFSARQPHLLAVGSADGSVSVWQLSSALTEQHPREGGALERLVSHAQ